MQNGNPMALMQRDRPPALTSGMRPVSLSNAATDRMDETTRRLYEIPHGPGDPGWADNIPPGEKNLEVVQPPDEGKPKRRRKATVTPETPRRTPVVAATPQKRVVVSYGKTEGTVTVAVEVAPDWDTEGAAVTVSLDAFKAMAPILEKLAKTKNLTSEEL